jgi:predicted ATPase
MIRHLHFRACKRLRDTTMEPARFSMLVGANAIGKSTLLDGLHILAHLPLDGASPGSAFDLLPFFSLLDQGPLSLEITDDQGRALGLVAHPRPGQPPALTIHCTPGPGRERTADPGLARRIQQDNLLPCARLRLQPNALARPCTPDAHPALQPDGEGLAACLHHLQHHAPATLARIAADLARVVPGVRHLRTTLTPRPGTDPPSVQTELAFADHTWVPAAAVSEGTLLALGIVTALHAPAPRLMLLDDLDRSLHPLAQRALTDLLRQTADARPGLQILATTHSPGVLDRMAPEEVFVACGVEGSGTRLQRLTQHPRWLASTLLRPGEFWSLVGESWGVHHP